MTKLTAMIELFNVSRLTSKHAAAVRVLGLVLFCVAVLVMLWIPDLITRTGIQLTNASDRLKVFQASLDEMERLKAKSPPAPITGTTLKAVLETTLGEQLPGLTVTMLESNQVRLAGRVEFDRFVRWLGESQNRHRLGIKTLTVEKQDDAASVDLVLFVGGE